MVTVVAAGTTAGCFLDDVAPEPGDVPVAVDLRDVWVRFPTTPVVTALAGVSLHVPRGGYTAVVGPAECGKTTLLTVLGVLRRPDRGEYSLFGRPTACLEAFERAQLRRWVELCPPTPSLVPHLTALENVELGMFTDRAAAPDRRARAHELLGALGMGSQYDVPAARLSGGERRRVAIAGALASRPSLLLVDDPTPELLDVIDAVRTDSLTVVTATRHAAVAERADEVVELGPVVF